MYLRWLTGHGEWKGDIADRHPVGILEIITDGVILHGFGNGPDSGDPFQLQCFGMSAHGRRTAVSTGYADYRGIPLVGYLLPQARIVGHVRPVFPHYHHFYAGHVLGKPYLHLLEHAVSGYQDAETAVDGRPFYSPR